MSFVIVPVSILCHFPLSSLSSFSTIENAQSISPFFSSLHSFLMKMKTPKHHRLPPPPKI
ncbi:hypothetical protein HanIR_Chr11g0528461 [Helianthus annuus]|nr:hypothetical protein HanIR_Chr11g0528461 [Helianthus annuus]